VRREEGRRGREGGATKQLFFRIDENSLTLTIGETGKGGKGNSDIEGEREGEESRASQQDSTGKAF